jgi:hypothetical protein
MPRPAALCIALALIGGAARAGEARCWFENGAVVVPAAFGDIAGDFILDLSAPRSQLHATRAQGDGVETPSARRTLRIAGARIAGVTMDVVDLDARTRTFPTSIVGVLGVDFARGRVIRIDHAPCRLTLSRHGPATQERALRARLVWAAGVPAILANVTDGVSARSGLFAIDTGAAATRVADATLSRQPAPGHSPPIRLRAVSLGGLIFEEIPAGLSNAGPLTLGGSIGTAVWSRFDLRLDMRRGGLELRLPPLLGEGRP